VFRHEVLLFTKQYYSDQTNEDEAERSGSTHGEITNARKDFVQEIGRKETTWKFLI
jgi:hypothetical protein